MKYALLSNRCTARGAGDGRQLFLGQFSHCHVDEITLKIFIKLSDLEHVLYFFGTFCRRG